MTTNITKASADGRTSAKAKAGAEPLLKLDMENYPNCFREWGTEDMHDGNIALALFLREAACGVVERFVNLDGAPNQDGDKNIVRGMEIAFDLLIERMRMINGLSPIPSMKDIWRDGNE